MRQLFVDFSNPVEGYTEAFELVDGALNTGETLRLSGSHQNVDVEFDLHVYSVLKRRSGTRKILEFTGVTEPEETPYHADFDASMTGPRIELQIFTKHDQE